MAEVEYRLLGPVEALVDGRPVAVGGARQRTLLAALVLRGGRVVSAGELVELIWGELPPRTAMTALHGLVSRLRRALDPRDGSLSPLCWRAPGYLLDISAARVDVP